jgi:hypothetical protein
MRVVSIVWTRHHVVTARLMVMVRGVPKAAGPLGGERGREGLVGVVAVLVVPGPRAWGGAVLGSPGRGCVMIRTRRKRGAGRRRDHAKGVGVEGSGDQDRQVILSQWIACGDGPGASDPVIPGHQRSHPRRGSAVCGDAGGRWPHAWGRGQRKDLGHSDRLGGGHVRDPPIEPSIRQIQHRGASPITTLDARDENDAAWSTMARGPSTSVLGAVAIWGVLVLYGGLDDGGVPNWVVLLATRPTQRTPLQPCPPGPPGAEGAAADLAGGLARA